MQQGVKNVDKYGNRACSLHSEFWHSGQCSVQKESYLFEHLVEFLGCFVEDRDSKEAEVAVIKVETKGILAGPCAKYIVF